MSVYRTVLRCRATQILLSRWYKDVAYPSLERYRFLSVSATCGLMFKYWKHQLCFSQLYDNIIDIDEVEARGYNVL